MTDSDISILVGYAIGSFLVGFSIGYAIGAVRRYLQQI